MRCASEGFGVFHRKFHQPLHREAPWLSHVHEEPREGTTLRRHLRKWFHACQKVRLSYQALTLCPLFTLQMPNQDNCHNWPRTVSLSTMAGALFGRPCSPSEQFQQSMAERSYYIHDIVLYMDTYQWGCTEDHRDRSKKERGNCQSGSASLWSVGGMSHPSGASAKRRHETRTLGSGDRLWWRWWHEDRECHAATPAAKDYDCQAPNGPQWDPDPRPCGREMSSTSTEARHAPWIQSSTTVHDVVQMARHDTRQTHDLEATWSYNPDQVRTNPAHLHWTCETLIRVLAVANHYDPESISIYCQDELVGKEVTLSSLPQLSVMVRYCPGDAQVPNIPKGWGKGWVQKEDKKRRYWVGPYKELRKGSQNSIWDWRDPSYGQSTEHSLPWWTAKDKQSTILAWGANIVVALEPRVSTTSMKPLARVARSYGYDVCQCFQLTWSLHLSHGAAQGMACIKQGRTCWDPSRDCYPPWRGALQ